MLVTVFRRVSPLIGTALACVSAFAFVASEALAHGGQFRGPVPAITGGPRGPGGAGSPGPRTGSLGDYGGPTSWSTWWEYNKDAYLNLREAIHDPGLVNASMGGQTSTGPSSLAPSDATKRDTILPALKALLVRDSNRDIQTACLVAMAKIAFDHPEFELLPLLIERLARGNQEIRETAAVSLGITRRADALPYLIDIASDSPAGRRLVKADSVDDRTRAFAAYGLGLVAETSDDVELQERVYDSLVRLLEVDNRDIRVAALQAMGALRLDRSGAHHKRLRWKAIATLWEFFDRDLGRGEELVQAHAPAAIARLLGRGTGAEHARAKSRFLDELDERDKRSDSIVQSAILALGKLVLSPEAEPDELPFVEALQRYAVDGKDELARYLCYPALAEIGGDGNRAFLLEALRKGRKATVKPWAALGLGVHAYHSKTTSGGAVDVTIGRALEKEIGEVKNHSFRAAACVALGLTGYLDASDTVLEVLSKARLQQALRGYASLGLGLMDAKPAIPVLRAVVADSEHMPIAMMQASIGLGLLGDKEATDLLVDHVRASGTSVMRLSGLATAFRFIGDRNVVDRLIALLEDRDLARLGRAFIAAALGGVADPNDLPWNTIYSAGTNYRATTGSLTNGATGILDIL